MKRTWNDFFRPSWALAGFVGAPTVETVGYYRSSLWDFSVKGRKKRRVDGDFPRFYSRDPRLFQIEFELKFVQQFIGDLAPMTELQ